MVDVYVFSSSNLTNLWAGVGASQWAVSPKHAENKSIRTKSRGFPVGAFGLFYCVENKTLSSPFVVTSKPDQAKVVEGVWNEHWHLPFTIKCLSDPRHAIRVDELQPVVSALAREKKSWNQLFFVMPLMAFTPSKLQQADWEALLNRLLPKTGIQSSVA